MGRKKSVEETPAPPGEAHAPPGEAHAPPREAGKEKSLSAIIKEVCVEFPEMKPAKIVEYLAGKGITVKVGLVNSVRSKGKKNTATTGKTVVKGHGMIFGVEDLDKVKEVVDSIGADAVIALAERLR
jgi:hypothetical protein